MHIKTYLLTICLIISTYNLHALDLEPYIPVNTQTIENLQQELAGFKDWRALLINLRTLTPEEKAEFMTGTGMSEDDFDHQISLLPGAEIAIARLERKITKLNNILYMNTQGA